MRFEYPVVVRKSDRGGVVVEFPDIPDLRITARSRADAYTKAQNVLDDYLIRNYRSNKRTSPLPSKPLRKQKCIAVPIQTATKLIVWWALRNQQLTNVALAKQLGVTEGVVRRLLNLKHHSQLWSLQRACNALGVIAVVDAEFGQLSRGP